MGGLSQTSPSPQGGETHGQTGLIQKRAQTARSHKGGARWSKPRTGESVSGSRTAEGERAGGTAFPDKPSMRFEFPLNSLILKKLLLQSRKINTQLPIHVRRKSKFPNSAFQAQRCPNSRLPRPTKARARRMPGRALQPRHHSRDGLPATGIAHCPAGIQHLRTRRPRGPPQAPLHWPSACHLPAR